MKKLILIITLLFVVCNVNAGFLNSEYFIVFGKVRKDNRWGCQKGQEITLEFVRKAGLVVSVECKELGFRYEFKDSQGVFLKSAYLEEDKIVTLTDGKQINYKKCLVNLGNFGFAQTVGLQPFSLYPSLIFWPNVDVNEVLVIDILLITHKYGENKERQQPYCVTFEENWLYRMFKEYDKVQK